jgi:hypothetical protein
MARYGRIGAYESWAHTEDRTARTAPARRAMLEKFERAVDPDGKLTPAERGQARRVRPQSAFSAARAQVGEGPPPRQGSGVPTQRRQRCCVNADERVRLRAEGRRRAAAELPDITPECARRIAELLREPINQYVAKQRRNRGAA